MHEADFWRLLKENRSSPAVLARAFVDATSDVPDEELIRLFKKAFDRKELSSADGRELFAALRRLGTAEEAAGTNPQIASLRAKTDQLEQMKKECLGTNETLKCLLKQAKKEISYFESIIKSGELNA